MTDTCKNNISKFVWKPLNHLFYYANENVSEEYLSKIVQFMEDLAVFTALNHSGFLGKNFVKF